MTGEGGARLAIDQESDLRDIREVGPERSADGQDGQSLSLDAGGVAGCEGACQIDNCHLGIWIWGAFACRQEEDLGYGCCSAADWVDGIRSGVEIEQPAEHGPGAGSWIGRKRQRADLRYECVFGVVGGNQCGLFGRGNLGGLSGCRGLASK